MTPGAGLLASFRSSRSKALKMGRRRGRKKEREVNRR